MQSQFQNSFCPQTELTYVDIEEMKRLVRLIGVKNFIAELAKYIEQDFLKWSAFDKSPRYASHSSDGVIELMPTSDGSRFSFKYVNGHPKNTRRGLQTVTAFGVLSDVATGYPLLLSEMTLLTALRTAATSALMATYLAPKNAKCMAMIGCGAQSEFQVLGFEALLGIQHIRLYDIDPSAAEKCRSNLSAQGIHVKVCTSATEAIEGAQIITTCTADKRNATILTEQMVPPGVHINAIGGDCPGKTELSAELLKKAHIFVEYAPQTRIEGDIQQLPESHPVTEMFNVISGSETGRNNAEQITIFDGVGFAIEDFSALTYVYDLVHAAEKIQTLELLANPINPRDLFSMVFTENTKPGQSVETRKEAMQCL